MGNKLEQRLTNRSTGCGEITAADFCRWDDVIMKKQYNHCGLRNDTVDLVHVNRTWCFVYDKEVENKQPGCEHWKPDDSSNINDKIQIANAIKSRNQEQIDGENREKIESKRHTETIEQQILARESVKKNANRAFVISIIAILIAFAGFIVAILKK